MGQAKRRGTFEERKAAAKECNGFQQMIKQSAPDIARRSAAKHHRSMVRYMMLAAVGMLHPVRAKKKPPRYMD